MNKSFLTLLKENWMIIIVIGNAIMTVTALQGGFRNHEERISKLEVYRDNETVVLSEIQSRLASIETSLIFIKEALK